MNFTVFNKSARWFRIFLFTVAFSTSFLTSAFAGTASIGIDAPEVVKKGDTFTVDLWMSDYNSIRALEVNLKFDQTKLQVIKYNGQQYIQPGPALSEALILYPNGGLKGENTLTLAAGWQAADGVSFSGKKSIGKITFKALVDSKTDLELVNTELIDIYDQKVSLTRINGSVVIDGNGPTIKLLYPFENSYINVNNPVISAKVYDSVSGVLPGSIKLSVSEMNISPTLLDNGEAVFKLDKILADGKYTAYIVAEDGVGNKAQYQWFFVVDTTPPPSPEIMEITNPVNLINRNEVVYKGFTEANNIIYAAFFDNEGNEVNLQVTADEKGYFTGNVDLSKFLDGIVTCKIYAVDMAGNEGHFNETKILKDTLINVIHFNVLSPLNEDNSNNVEIVGKTEPNANLSISFIDKQNKKVTVDLAADENGDFKGNASVSMLEDGLLQIVYKVTDKAGNSAEFSIPAIEKDTMIQIQLVQHNAKKPLIIGNNLEIVVFGEQGLTVGYSLGPLTGQLGEISPGYYTVKIQISGDTPTINNQNITLNLFDKAGNSLVYELTPPVSIITSQPEITSVSHTSKIAFKAGDELKITMKGSPGNIAQVSIGSIIYKAQMMENAESPGTYTYTFIVNAGNNAKDIKITVFLEDQAGNITSCIDPVEVTFDTISPVTKYKISPSKPDGLNGWYKTNPTVLSLLAEDAATIFYRVNDAQEVSATSPVEINFSEDGIYIIEFYSIDAAGNVEAVPGKLTLNVKVSKPLPPEITTAVNVTNQNTVKVSVKTGPGYQIEILRKGLKVNEGFADSDGNLTVDVILREGSNEIKARATDMAGNKSEYSGTLIVTRDSQGPVFQINTGNPDANGKVSVSIFVNEKIADGTLIVQVRKGDAGSFQPIDNLQFNEAKNLYTGWFTITGNETVTITASGEDELNNPGTGVYTKKIIYTGNKVQINNKIDILIPEDVFGEQQFAKAGTFTIVTSTTSIGLEQAKQHDLDPVNVMDFGPSMQFEKDIYVWMSYDPVYDPASLSLYFWNEQKQSWDNWRDNILEIDEAAHQIKFRTNHFSIYGIFMDKTPPVLTVELPEGHWLTKDPAVSISGITEPKVRVWVESNGTVRNETVADDNGAFLLSGVGLEPDIKNTIEIVAVDGLENESRTTVFIFQDSSAPAINIVTPANNTKLKENIVHLQGNTEEGCEVTLKVNENSPITLGTLGSFCASVKLSKEGANSLVFTAKDPAGNNSEKILTIFKDSTAPSIALATVKDGMSTANNYVAVEGISEAGATIEISNNNTEVAKITLNNHYFSQKVDLTPGPNLLRIIAIDSVGNSQINVLTIYYDPQAPKIVLSKPAAGYLETPYSTLDMSGHTNAGAVITLTLKNSKGDYGKTLVNADGSFSETVALTAGKNTIIITSFDQYGASEAMVEIYYIDTGGFVQGKVIRIDSNLSGVDVKLKNDINQYQSTTDHNGQFNFIGVTPGAYKIFFTKAGYLPAEINAVKVEQGKISFADKELLFGNFIDLDYEEYSAIDIYDLMKIVGVYGVEKGEDLWDVIYDCNLDDVIDLMDIMSVVRNYGAEYISEPI